MDIKNICDQLNIAKQCREYQLSIWQCPQFLFLAMGMLIIISMLGTYYIAAIYTPEPEIVALIVIGVTTILLIFMHLIVNIFEQLVKVNKLKSEFISVASHQLRAPLASLKWTLSILLQNERDLTPDKRMEYISIIKNSNDRMIKLVNDLLDVSRIETKTLELPFKKEFSIVKTIQTVINELTPLAKASNITINAEFAPNLPKLKGDEERIALVAQNLLDNAIKYTKKKGEIFIKADLESNQKYVKVSVIDQGVGIPQNQQGQIFQKFFRSDNIMKHQVIGTGLGLFIAKAVIENHKGKIGFSSKEGQGSTFWFTLPINRHLLK